MLCNGQPMKRTVILNPVHKRCSRRLVHRVCNLPSYGAAQADRRMDAAIFHAFQTGDLSPVFAALGVARIDFQRVHADGTTALMAAAFHGDLDAVRRLLELGATVTLSDVHGNDAIGLAKMRGHRETAILLEQHAAKEYVRH